MQDSLFDANNTAVLIPKEKFRNEMNLHYFAKLLGRIFLNFLSSENQVNYLGKDSLANIDIDYPFPSLKEQNIFIKNFEKLEIIKKNIELIIKKIDSILECSLILEEGSNLKKINEIFNIYGGNSGLTESVIYFSRSNKSDHIKVVSASLQQDTQMGYISEKTLIKNKPIKIFKEKSVVITRKGNAGRMMFIDEPFTINDDAYVIEIKKKYKHELNIKYFMIIGEKYSKLATSMDGSNGTFSKSIFEQLEIPYPFPAIEKQNLVVKFYEKLENMKTQSEGILKKISL